MPGIDPLPPEDIPNTSDPLGSPKVTNQAQLDLQLKLAAYHRAIEGEFNLLQDAAQSGEADKIAEAARKMLTDHTPSAVRTLTWLAENADSESVRMNCSKYILDNVLGKSGLATPVDPLEKLVKELQGNAPTKQPTNSE